MDVKKILLVDDDAEFIAYFLALVKPYNLSFDICNTLKDAREKISLSSYDAYIFDLNLPDGSGVDLIQELRNNEPLKPIAAISGAFRDEKMFALLKDKYAINYILDKPVYPKQIDALIISLFPQKIEAVDRPPDPFDKLRADYSKTTSTKLAKLTELVKGVQDIPSKETLGALKFAVHKIAGSAGSYGFTEASSLCKEMEQKINNQLESNEEIKGWNYPLEEFLRKIKYSLQFEDSQSLDQKAATDFLSRPSLYVIDPDTKFLELLQREKAEFGIDLFTESSPQKALAKLKLPEFNPRIIVATHTFSGSSIGAFELFEAVRKKEGEISTIFVIILEKEGIDARIEAINKGVEYIFQKPLSAEILLKTISEALDTHSSRNFKVLILDDDLDVCHFISSCLSEIGFESKFIDDPLLLYKALEEYSPDLLFLDIILPNYDGFHLLKTLKADPLYKNLSVIIITARQEADTQLRSISARADEVLIKPLNKQIVQQSVMNFSEKSSSSTTSISSKNLFKKLDEILPRNSSFLVLFRIDRYSEMVLQKGQRAINDFSIAISNSLQRIEETRVTCYSLDAGTFAIIFEGLSGSEVEKKMFNLLASIQSQSTLNISFCCSIVPVFQSLGNSRQIVQLAEKGLNEAQNKEPAPLRITNLAVQEGQGYKKTLMLIEPTEDLLNILKTAFLSYDLNIKAFSEGKPALGDLLNCKEEELPALIIAERKLPDMDSIEILKGLNERFKSQIPFYFLTDFVAEKDISEGLKYGALEYITKPFSLSLLVQKAIKAISD